MRTDLNLCHCIPLTQLAQDSLEGMAMRNTVALASGVTNLSMVQEQLSSCTTKRAQDFLGHEGAKVFNHTTLSLTKRKESYLHIPQDWEFRQ